MWEWNCLKPHRLRVRDEAQWEWVPLSNRRLAFLLRHLIYFESWSDETKDWNAKTLKKQIWTYLGFLGLRRKIMLCFWRKDWVFHIWGIQNIITLYEIVTQVWCHRIPCGNLLLTLIDGKSKTEFFPVEKTSLFPQSCHTKHQANNTLKNKPHAQRQDNVANSKEKNKE